MGLAVSIANGFRKPEVCYLDMVHGQEALGDLIRYKDVFQLQVAVHDAMRVQEGEAFDELPEYEESFALLHLGPRAGPAEEGVEKVAASHHFQHHEKPSALLFYYVHQLHDVGVRRQRLQDANLPAELLNLALKTRAELNASETHRLHGKGSPVGHTLALVNSSEGTVAELAAPAVGPEHLWRLRLE